MKRAKTTMMLAAKWLVVIAISLVVLPGNVFASKPAAPKQTCNAACAARCPCCVSKAPAPNPPAPLAPVSQSRPSVEKSFQFVPLLALLLAPVSESAAKTALNSTSDSSGSNSPLYQRHCVYLI